MKRLQQTYHIKAPPGMVWQALTDPESINAWGGGPARMDGRAGTEFELWGGDIHGTNTEVARRKKLVQAWYSGDWPEPSVATFFIEPEEGGTRLLLVHRNVPDAEYEDIRDGWRHYYLGPMKEWLER